jgi:hypothetical protein
MFPEKNAEPSLLAALQRLHTSPAFAAASYSPPGLSLPRRLIPALPDTAQRDPVLRKKHPDRREPEALFRFAQAPNISWLTITCRNWGRGNSLAVNEWRGLAYFKISRRWRT